MEPAAGIMVSESPILDSSSSNNGDDDDDESYNNNNNNNSSERADNDVMLLAPKSVHNQATDLFVPIGEVNIYCIYNANPTELVPNSTRWFKDGKPLTITSPQPEQQQPRMFESMTPTGYPVLTIRQVNRRDAGLYDCQLSNTVGTSERLPLSEACRVEVNFKPSVKLRVFKPQISVVPQMSSIDGSIPMDELIELDINKELVLPGSTFVLVCDIVEAQPRKIQKYHWFKTTTASQNLGFRQTNKLAAAGNGQQQLISVTDSKQFVLNSLAANFTVSSFTCSAFNALGPSEQSNQIEVQLSYSPGKSFREIFSDRQLTFEVGEF